MSKLGVGGVGGVGWWGGVGVVPSSQCKPKLPSSLLYPFFSLPTFWGNGSPNIGYRTKIGRQLIPFPSSEWMGLGAARRRPPELLEGRAGRLRGRGLRGLCGGGPAGGAPPSEGAGTCPGIHWGELGSQPSGSLAFFSFLALCLAAFLKTR